MDSENRKNKPFSTVKAASPDTLFARYLQKQGKRPTRNQISVWENEGGQGYENPDNVVFIHGFLCRNLKDRICARTTHAWRVLKFYVKGGRRIQNENNDRKYL